MDIGDCVMLVFMLFTDFVKEEKDLGYLSLSMRAMLHIGYEKLVPVAQNKWK